MDISKRVRRNRTAVWISFLFKALEGRFAPANQTDLYRAQLIERRQRSSETLSEVSRAARRLTCLAYPSTLAEVSKALG